MSLPRWASRDLVDPSRGRGKFSGGLPNRDLQLFWSARPAAFLLGRSSTGRPEPRLLQVSRWVIIFVVQRGPNNLFEPLFPFTCHRQVFRGAWRRVLAGGGPRASFGLLLLPVPGGGPIFAWLQLPAGFCVGGIFLPGVIKRGDSPAYSAPAAAGQTQAGPAITSSSLIFFTMKEFAFSSPHRAIAFFF